MMKHDLHKYPIFQDTAVSEPVLLSQQGFSNENYSFFAHSKKYLLRCFKLQDRDRAQEYRIQKAAYEEGIAAEPLVLDLSSELMICEFLEGEHREALEDEELKALAALMQKVHGLKVDAEVLELETLFSEFHEEVEEALSLIRTFPREMRVCHNDPNPQNILFTSSGPKLIDWEFAAINDRYFDLAAVCVEFALSKRDTELFLNRYFEEEMWQWEKLDAYKVIYKALCKQWFETFPSSS